MYKKQMTAQRVICLLSIIASAIVFLYSLGLMTDLYDSLYPTMMNPADLTETDVPGSIIYYDMQGFNRTLLKVSIGLILASVLLFVTNTQVRRKYYIGNYFAVIVNVAANVCTAIWAHGQLEMFKAQFLQIDFDALQFFVDLWETPYIDSTFWFDAHYVVFALTLCVSLLLVLNVFWKIGLMNGEKKLLRQGKAVS